MSTAALPHCPACRATASDLLGGVAVKAQHLAYCDQDAARARALDEHIGFALDDYRLHRCSSCSLEYAHPPLAPSSRWYGALYGAMDLYPSARWEYEVVASQLAADDVVIDYGCGSGHFLQLAAPTVRRAIGFDFSADAIAGALARGIDARVLGEHDGAAAPGAPEVADHVVAFHVLEHLPDPRTLLDFARGRASPMTRLWVAVPSDRRASRLYGETDTLDLPPHHLTRWTPEALRRLGQACGWTLTRIAYEPLSARLRVWEATRRLALYHRVTPANRTARWLYRRLLATGVALLPRHRMQRASGFSMLACFTWNRTP